MLSYVCLRPQLHKSYGLASSYTITRMRSRTVLCQSSSSPTIRQRCRITRIRDRITTGLAKPGPSHAATRIAGITCVGIGRHRATDRRFATWQRPWPGILDNLPLLRRSLPPIPVVSNSWYAAAYGRQVWYVNPSPVKPQLLFSVRIARCRSRPGVPRIQPVPWRDGQHVIRNVRRPRLTQRRVLSDCCNHPEAAIKTCPCVWLDVEVPTTLSEIIRVSGLVQVGEKITSRNLRVRYPVPRKVW